MKTKFSVLLILTASAVMVCRAAETKVEQHLSIDDPRFGSALYALLPQSLGKAKETRLPNLLAPIRSNLDAFSKPEAEERRTAAIQKEAAGIAAPLRLKIRVPVALTGPDVKTGAFVIANEPRTMGEIPVLDLRVQAAPAERLPADYPEGFDPKLAEKSFARLGNISGANTARGLRYFYFAVSTSGKYGFDRAVPVPLDRAKKFVKDFKPARDGSYAAVADIYMKVIGCTSEKAGVIADPVAEIERLVVLDSAGDVLSDRTFPVTGKVPPFPAQ